VFCKSGFLDHLVVCARVDFGRPGLGDPCLATIFSRSLRSDLENRKTDARKELEAKEPALVLARDD
jgi:hypothetical protein